ncbi:glycoside hydrolase family 28 protein [Aquimarina celericrescens]|uniref:Glycoside hydrolase family 28 protein n=1 Tax=Aquimarina celericrescens TaxID=1964542 RepID=A0ABW5B0C0_9FLAO|nr:right-handed parallel beta-helix repeat-containing protein [Aquimarina celericrescens]
MRFFILTITVLISISCQINNDRSFNIVAYGAIPDGKTLNTKSIQEAIEKAIENKGKVIIPKGKFYTGSLTLGPNMTLQLNEGAELIASSNMQNYSGPNFIFAPDADNLTIRGKGVINGNGESFFDEQWNYDQRPRPWIVIQDAKNVSVSGITLVNSPSHCLVFNFCEDVAVDSLTIKNHPRSPNTDGIDIINSKNILITNCIISTGDDAICIKNKRSSKYFENEALNRSRYTENILVKNCILESDDAALKLGTGSSYHTRNCSFQDVRIKNSRYGIALFMMDGGIYSDLSFKNITIKTGGRQKDEYGIFVDTHRRDSLSAIGTIKNINFKDIDITTNGLLYFSGYPEKEISKITLENVKVTVPDADNTITAGWKKPKGNKKIKYWNNTVSYIQSPGSMIVAHAKDFKIKNLMIHHQQGKMDRHGIYLIDVKGLDTMDVKGNTLYKESFVFTKK